MFKIKINEKRVITVVPEGEDVFSLDGDKLKPDILEIRNGVFHVILENRSYNAEVIKHDVVEKTFSIRVNDNVYKLEVRDKYDELLKALGLDNLNTGKAADLKAPMPGLVVEVAVAEGQHVVKGDKLIVLEAMKMENVLKAASDGTVKKVNVTKGRTVEKNEILIVFN